MILRPYKRIKELEETVRSLTIDKDFLGKRVQELKNEIGEKKEGLHKTSALCTGCVNSIVDGWIRYCKLDCKCEDREEIE